MALQPGTYLKHYLIEKPLARGTLSSTYLAYDEDNAQQVIIKELLFQNVDNWKQLELFEREARTLKNISHPQIPRWIDDFQQQSDDTYYLVTEYVAGDSLLEKIERGWKPTEAEVIGLIEQSLDILVYLHGRQPPVIHRDIKPSNLMLDPHNRLHLIDFGAVQDLIHPEGGKTVVGTFGYMAPEQFSGQAQAASDLYGLGATVLHILSGRPPSQIPLRGQELHFQDYIQVSPELLLWLKVLVDPHLSKRFRSATEAKINLHKILNGEILSFAGHSPKKAFFMPLRWAVLVGFLGLLGTSTALGWSLFQKTEDKNFVSTCFKQPIPPPAYDLSPGAEAFRKTFQTNFPHPDWWENTQAPAFDSLDALMVYWQCDSRSKQQFFKAAYVTILSRPLNDQLVVNAINLMPWGDPNYPDLEKLLSFGLETYYYHQNHSSIYQGKSGDQIAGIARQLVSLYNQRTAYAETIDTLERFIPEREAEINDHLLQHLSREYAYALWKTEQKERALQVLQHALSHYPEGSWTEKLETLQAMILKN